MVELYQQEEFTRYVHQANKVARNTEGRRGETRIDKGNNIRTVVNVKSKDEMAFWVARFQVD